MLEQTRNMSATLLHSLTEDELANWRREQGYRVHAHRGRFWMESPPGFLQPLHWVARFSRQEASPPIAPSWVSCRPDRERSRGCKWGVIGPRNLRCGEIYDRQPFFKAPQRSATVS